MKTILAALLVSFLCACGGGDDEPAPQPDKRVPLDCSGTYQSRSAACK